MRQTLKPKADDTWLSFSFTLFIMFLMREGWTKAEAIREAEIMRGCGAKPTVFGKNLSDRYTRASRVGLTKKLTRQDRLHICLVYESACNHASIHDYNEVTA